MDFQAQHRKRSPQRRRWSAILAAIFAALSIALATSASATTFAPQATLTASDEIGKSLLGSAVALSHDGNTALVGGPEDDQGVGAVWVFIRRGSRWHQQAKLTGGGEVGSGNFGTSVALSSDGKTALIGGREDNVGTGAAWVFTRAGKRWTQQGEKLPGESSIEYGGSKFGSSVALSGDGSTALVGDPNYRPATAASEFGTGGAAWVFTRSHGIWTRQGGPLTFLEGHDFGQSVALSVDGNTALIGSPKDFPRNYGSAAVLTRTGLTWSGAEILHNPEGGFTYGFGLSVSLSGDGSTALIQSVENIEGYPGGERGTARVYTRVGSAWRQQSNALTYRTEGDGVALSSDGNKALIYVEVERSPPGGGTEKPEVARAFTRSGATWTQGVQPLTCRGVGGFVCSVALSSDGSTALVGTAVYVNSPHK